MQMVNISSLGNLASAEPLDLDLYEDAKESSGFQLPKAGRYTVRSPESFPAESFGKTNTTNQLSVRIDPQILGPTNEGFTTRYISVYATTYERGGKRVSSIGDYLRACGVTGTVPSEPQALADAIAKTAGKTYEVELDWEASKGRKGEADFFQLKGMNRFPDDGSGGHQSWVAHPTLKSEDGSPLRLMARLVVRRFVPMAA